MAIIKYSTYLSTMVLFCQIKSHRMVTSPYFTHRNSMFLEIINTVAFKTLTLPLLTPSTLNIRFKSHKMLFLDITIKLIPCFFWDINTVTIEYHGIDQHLTPLVKHTATGHWLKSYRMETPCFNRYNTVF